MSDIVTIAPKPGSLALIFDEEKIELIKKTICKGASNDELSLFLMQCQRTGLDPFARQIYSVERRSKNKNGGYDTSRTTQVSIDGFRLIADRTGKYTGQKPTEWCGKDGIWKEIWLLNEPPFAARVGVLRKDFSEPLYAVAKWNAYAGDNFGGIQKMWAKMPDHMLAKVAEALALRKAFPQELSGLYTGDELGEVIDSENNSSQNMKENKTINIPSSNISNSGSSLNQIQPSSLQSDPSPIVMTAKEDKDYVINKIKFFSDMFKIDMNNDINKENMNKIYRSIATKNKKIDRENELSNNFMIENEFRKFYPEISLNDLPKDPPYKEMDDNFSKFESI